MTLDRGGVPSLTLGDPGSLSLEESGSGSLSVMQGVMLHRLWRLKGDMTPWKMRQPQGYLITQGNYVKMASTQYMFKT